MGIILIIIVVIIIGLIWILSNNDDESVATTIRKNPPLPDFATRDPQTEKLKFNIDFSPSTTDVGIFLIFDVETTGLPKDKNAKSEDVDNWPRVVQISWLLLDSDYNYVNFEEAFLKQDAPIPQEAIKIHGIDDKIIEEKGEDPKSVFEKLLADIKASQFVIAHNIDFDLPIIEAEFIRLGLKKPFEGKKQLCTMREGTRYCKIPRYSGEGYKYPKLVELFQHCYFPGLTSLTIDQSHNAKADVMVTTKCFIKLKELGYFKV
jgi:DNA polymerase III epsilon subunit-like protein